MASLCRRVLYPIIRRQVYTSAYRSSDCKDDSSWPDYTRGPEKYQSLSIERGEMDPFDVKIEKRGTATKESPRLIGSYFKSRLVGCICTDEQYYINWMWLHKGEPQRCECGYWFKLIERKSVVQISEKSS